MKQIVVATDFSNCATNAMEYAVELALLLNIEICAFHAIHPTEGIDNNVYNAFFIEDYYKNKRQSLTNWANSFIDKDGYKDLKVTTACEVGFLTTALTKYCESNDVALLAMGSMGSTGISGLFGSNVNSIVTRSKIPTLVIPLESKISKYPVITLATDFTTNLTTNGLNSLNLLLSAFNADKLNVLNVLDKPEWKKNEAGEKNITDLLPGHTLDFKYIHEDSTHEGIMNFIVSSNTDILCLVKHHHHVLYRLFNKSLVNQVMNKSVKAVLVLHE